MTESAIQAQCLNTFDPTEDGWVPASLDDVMAAGRAAMESISSFRVALHGCTTPLNLKQADASLASMLHEVKEQLQVLEKVQQVIETDTALARRFPGEAPWAESGGALSPKQILSLAARADAPAEQTTYRAVVEELNPVPTLLVKDRSMGFSAEGSTDWDDIEARRYEHRRQLVLDILAGLEAVECSSCHAPAGSPCVTAAGGIAHESHMPRRRAYTLRPEHSWVSADVNRRPDNQLLHPELRGKSWQEVKAIVDSRK